MQPYPQRPLLDKSVNAIYVIGILISGISLILPYATFDTVIFGSYDIKGIDYPLAALIVIIGILLGVTAIVKYEGAKFQENLKSANQLGIGSSIAIGLAIVLYYLDYQNGLNYLRESQSVDLSPLLHLGLGFFGFVLGAGFMLFGAYSVTTQYKKLPHEPRMYPPFPGVQTQYSYPPSINIQNPQYGQNVDLKPNLTNQQVIKDNSTLNDTEKPKFSFCNMCGQHLTEGMVFCGNCGHKI